MDSIERIFCARIRMAASMTAPRATIAIMKKREQRKDEWCNRRSGRCDIRRQRV